MCRWCTLHPTAHYLVNAGYSEDLDAVQLRDIYRKLRYVVMVTLSSHHEQEARFLTAYEAELEEIERRERADHEDALTEDDALEVLGEQCANCGQRMSADVLRRHQGACTGKVRPLEGTAH